MKTYSIGRDVNCDIVINDTTDVISRRHALLNVTSSGKMTIIDQSSNGTYVNGIRISQNVPVPVTRKDTISLAHVTKLDWAMVPKSNAYMWYVLSGLAGILIVVGVIFGIKMYSDNNDINNNNQEPEPIVDTISSEMAEQARLDSLADVKRDSLFRARQDSIKEAAKQDSIKQAGKKKQPQKNKEEKPASGTKQDVG